MGKKRHNKTDAEAPLVSHQPTAVVDNRQQSSSSTASTTTVSSYQNTADNACHSVLIHASTSTAASPKTKSTNDTKLEFDDHDDPLLLKDALGHRMNSLYSCEYVGLLMNYICIGFLTGFYVAMVYPFFQLYLNMASYQVNSATAVITLPWSYKTFFGILTDHYPIAGYYRKSYMVVGWLIALGCTLVLAFARTEPPYYYPGEIQRTQDVNLRQVLNEHAPDAGSWYLIIIMLVTLGFVISNVACDGVMVQLDQQEPLLLRGSIQSSANIARFASNFVGTVVAGVAFNGQEFGGSFLWSVPYECMFLMCSGVCLTGIFSSVWLLEEDSDAIHNDDAPLKQMWKLIQHRALWQVILFNFLNSFLNNFGISSNNAIQDHWAQVDPLTNNISKCLRLVLRVVASWLAKEYFLNTSWWLLVLWSSVFTIFVNAFSMLIIIFDVVRSKWFFVSGPLLETIPDQIRFMVGGFLTVEIVDPGYEGSIYALVTTVQNLAIPFSTAMTNWAGAQFDVTDEDIVSDTSYVRWEVTYTLIISVLVQMLGLLTLYLLPQQKKQAQELKLQGGSSVLAAWIIVLGIGVAMVVSTTLNILSIASSTACLAIAGGPGC